MFHSYVNLPEGRYATSIGNPKKHTKEIVDEIAS